LKIVEFVRFANTMLAQRLVYGRQRHITRSIRLVNPTPHPRVAVLPDLPFRIRRRADLL
jgi:hypothetical protein